MRSVDSKQESPTGIVRATLVATALAAAAAALPGCITDPDCGICDPENLILETIAAANYANKEIRLLSPTCEGPNCPPALDEAKFYVETIGPCELTADATTAPRGAEEWCKISPLLVGAGLNFIFNNLLDPQSVELVRKRLDNPQLFEVYDWKTKILAINGPITRFNGDYIKGRSGNPDEMTRAVNLSCIENFADAGIPFDHTSIEAQACDGLQVINGQVWPLRTRLDQEIKATTGFTDWRSTANSCDTPESGPDLCCTACDYELSVNVARYGAGRDAATSVACNPAEDDKFIACRDVVPEVDRSGEDRTPYNYLWNGEMVSSAVPLQDRLRETHPDDRPVGLEQRNVPCTTRNDCISATAANLPGSECVGRLANSGVACSQDSNEEECVDRMCVAEWFISCETTQVGGRCVDRRFDEKGTAGCFTVNESLVAYNSTLDQSRNVGRGRRLAEADIDENGLIDADEGCGQGTTCDPFDRSRATPITVYDRNRTLPEPTRNCVCPGSESAAASQNERFPECAEVVDRLCRDKDNNLVTEKANQWATRFVNRSGGVIYDPAIKGVAFRPADLGTTRRAFTERCAAGTSPARIGALNVKDGWRANDSGAESEENFDRAMCSSSAYEIIFAVPSDSDVGENGQYIRDKVNNDLTGRRTYRFTTPDFHIVPGSGFPPNNLRIGACDRFTLNFSNKYDMSAQNLRKIQIVELDSAGGNEVRVVAGGLNCTDDPESVSMSTPPCLTLDVNGQNTGKIGAQVDPKDFGQALRTGRTYRFKVPGLDNVNGVPINSYKDFQDLYNSDPAAATAAYQSVFWDACGMPLIVGGAAQPDHYFDFFIDPPKAKEDRDGILGLSLLDVDADRTCDRLGDTVQFSCDNAPNHYNPEQRDTDRDGFGDVYDLCVTVATAINTADSDKDGVGNECDTCSKQPSVYNKDAAAAGVSPRMMVRNTPYQGDVDGDGIGDACDNCVQTPNCGTFGNTPGLTPFKVGDRAPIDDSNICQTDIDSTLMVGDACADGGVPITYPGAAGPIGFGNDDDFDGDGIRNIADYCPRIPIKRRECNDNSDCVSPDAIEACAGESECGTVCTDGVCNHADTDNDQVGDLCDTCPFVPNPGQVVDGMMQEDDEDNDFVGRACETTAACYNRADPRPYGFYDVSVNGWCCTVTFDEFSKTREPREPYEVERDAEGNIMIVGGGRPITVDCPDEEDPTCVKLPDSVLSSPGVVTLPEGCEDALINAGYDPANKVYASRVTLADFGGDEAAFWDRRCTLPQFDQDFDGIGDICDLCPFAFDPQNQPYVNESGRLFTNAGRYCNGAYSVDEIQAALEVAQPDCYDEEADSGDTDGGDTEGGDTDGGTTGG